MITPQEALQRTIEHREVFHDEMLHIVRLIMSGECSPVMMAALITGLRVKKETIGEIAAAAKAAGVSLRIGVNAGSLDPRLLQKYGKATPEALAESARWEASLFEEHDFHDFKISVKHNDPVVMIEAYKQLAAQCDYPLHLGVTEAGPAFQGTICLLYTSDAADE